MTQKHKKIDPNAYNPTFQLGFLAPKYWGLWLAIILLLPVILLPKKAHIWLASRIANKLAEKRRGTTLNIWVNLSLCFPDKSDEEKEKILRDCLTTAGAFLLSFPLITIFGKRYLERNTVIHGLEHIKQLRERGENILLLSPHTWAIDVLPLMLAVHACPMVAMVKQQKNLVGDWLMHRQRMQFNGISGVDGKIYERSMGIKPYLKSVREGYIGYYLPDQDHGREQSIFVDFFGVKKATLPGISKLAKVTRATVVPSFTAYNINTGKYEVTIFPPWDGFPSGDLHDDARKMNEFIEQQLIEMPEQYMWIFQIFRNRPDLDAVNPYRDEQYKKQVMK